MNVSILPLIPRPHSPAEIILVQGLDGELYGRRKDVSPFVLALAESCPDHRITGLLYPDRLRDYASSNGLAVPPIAAKLRAHMAQSTGSTVLICHCLGALICSQALMGLRGCEPVHAILLDALSDHPALTTDEWGQGLLATLGLELTWMRHHGQSWRDFLSPTPPRWLQVDAILSQPISWITPFCPANGIAAERQHVMDLDHQELVVQTAGRGPPVSDLIHDILSATC